MVATKKVIIAMSEVGLQYMKTIVTKKKKKLLLQ